MFKTLPTRMVARAFGWIALASALMILWPAHAFAQNLNQAPMIFDVRKSLPLEPTEPAYHDFYINAGPDAGFKKGQFVTVVRQVPVHDPVQNKQQGILHITVARLQVIHVERTITVARLHSEFTDEERPTLEFEAVMIGDRVDPASLTMEAPAKKKKGVKSAESKKEEPKQFVQVDVAEQAPAGPAPAAATQAAVAAAPAPASAPQGPAAAVQKNSSPSTNSPDMVRVPIPAGTTTL